MEQRLMPDILDIREITFTNLLLLDFRPEIYEARHRCPFNRDAFVFPNKKAMEAVFYFLFTKLNSDVAQEEFRHCWPIHDKKQESAFRKVSIQWLNRISKEVHDSNIPRVVASVLLSPGGDKFYHLLFSFSSFVLKEEIKKGLRKCKILLPRSNNAEVLTTKIALETERFLQNARLSSKAHNEWVLFASELTKENRNIRKKRREIEKEIKDLETEHLKRGLLSPAASRSSRHDSPYSGQIKSLKRTKIIQRVREYWNRIKEMYESHKILREKVDQVMQGSANKYALKASNIDIKIPDLLLRECEEEIYQRRIGNTFESGRVNLLSLIQLLNLSLHLILDQIRSHPLPSVSEEEASVRDKLHAQSVYLQTTKSLKEIIENEMIPELKDSIDELQEKIEYSSSLKRFTPKTNRKFDFNLTGLPMTPSVHLTSGPSSEHQKDPVAFSRDLFPDENVLTPDAVEKMLLSLRDTTTNANPDDIEKEAIERPPTGSATKKNKTLKQSTKHRIPVPKARTTARQNLKKRIISNPDDAKTLSQEMRKELSINESQSINIPTRDDREAENQKIQLKREERIDQSKGERTARDILADKIAFSVLSKHDNHRSSSSSSSSRCTTPLDHGLEDPLSAISKDAFTAKDKIQRTPLKKDHQTEERLRSHNPLQSNFASTLPEEVMSPNLDHRLFGESFTETPKNSIFDTPLRHHTPNRTNLDGANIFTKSKNASRLSANDLNRKWNDFYQEGHEAESPQFDENFQTPQVNRAIESSVKSSILRPRNLHENSGLEDSPYETRRQYDTKDDEESIMNMTPLQNEVKSISQSSSKSPIPFPKTEDEVTRPKMAVPDKVAVSDKGAIPDKVGIPDDFRFLDETKDRSLNKNKLHEVGKENGLKKAVEISSGKEDLADVIKRFKNLKQKSKKINSWEADLDDKNYVAGDILPKDENSDIVDDFKLIQKDKNSNVGFDSAMRKFSLEFDNGTPSQEHNSFLEIARNSAKKEIATWSDLKSQITADDDDMEISNSKLDSFDDLEIPVAKQLSFVQLDARGISPELRHINRQPVARTQIVAKRNVDHGEQKDLDLLFGFNSPGNFETQSRISSQSYAADNSLLSDTQREARSFENVGKVRGEENGIEASLKAWDRGGLRTRPRLESDEPEIPLLKNNSSPFIEMHITNLKNQTKFYNESKNDFSVNETPKLKTLDDSFNIFTPGLKLRRDLEKFSLDMDSPGLDGGFHENENEPLNQDVNLIDF